MTDENEKPEKTYNALEVLGEVSGVGTDEAKRIFDEVKANLALLDGCPRHVFEPNKRQGKLVRDYKCKRCGGVLDSINVRWYNRGLVDGAQHDPA